MDRIDKILICLLSFSLTSIIIVQDLKADKRFSSFLELERKVELLERKVEVLRTITKITPNGY